MSVYKKFDRTDLIDSVLSVSPQFNFVSGTAGWRGSSGLSSSIPLFDGVRGRSDLPPGISVKPVFRRDYVVVSGEPFDVTGSYPMSASVKYVTARPEANSSHGSTNWGEEHWDVLMRAYELNSRYASEYKTGSYDYYSLYFGKASSNILARSGSIGQATWDTMSSSFTMEFMIKPYSVTGQDYTIASRNGAYYLGITGSTGQLVFSGSFMGRFTSSIGPEIGRWSHVAVRAASNTGSFTIDLVDAGTFTFTGSIARTSPTSPSPTIGNVFLTPLAGGSTIESGSDVLAVGPTNMSFHGMIHEARFWSIRRTDQQLSASFNTTLRSTGSVSNLVAYYRMNQGPLFRSDSDPALYRIGSGVLDHSGNGQHLSLGSFSSRRGPVWQPNDNAEFYPDKAEAFQSSSLSLLRVFNIPSIMYGRQIATGSVEITCKAYSAAGAGMVRVLKDDGRGGLYISGSMFSSSLESKESYRGVDFNKVGNVFYSEGLIVIKDPSLFDLGDPTTTLSAHTDDLLSLSFKGYGSIPMKLLMCRADGGEFNASNNPTFAEIDPATGKPALTNGAGSPTYITAVGLYDENRRLVGIAKLAQPIRKREQDRTNIKLRFDF